MEIQHKVVTDKWESTTLVSEEGPRSISHCYELRAPQHQPDNLLVVLYKPETGTLQSVKQGLRGHWFCGKPYASILGPLGTP